MPKETSNKREWLSSYQQTYESPKFADWYFSFFFPWVSSWKFNTNHQIAQTLDTENRRGLGVILLSQDFKMTVHVTKNATRVDIKSGHHETNEGTKKLNDFLFFFFFTIFILLFVNILHLLFQTKSKYDFSGWQEVSQDKHHLYLHSVLLHIFKYLSILASVN